MPPSLIPRTDIDLLYRDVCKRPGGPQARLDWAAREDPVETIASAFARSIEQLDGYVNDEPFRDPNTKARTEADLDDVRSTLSVALRLKAQGRLQPAEDDPLAYRYVEREVVPQRTTGRARFNDPRQEVADGPANSAMKIDLLLEADDGAPAVGEIKIRTDRDPVCALVQVLAAAALLATEPQRERLDLHHNLRTDGRLDAVILLVDFPGADLMGQARTKAQELAEALVADPRVGDHVRRIVAFEATADATLAGGPLTADVAFRADAPAKG
ncbi:unannotated protein [freshwater metagenome]|uniref:Unannotated protein n=1 Tax=freshwater metagenome TaxID=449393 RepID=A0A6J7I9Q6_9ZZZZ|nr:hypothetical protein [Actinomycetota bacterium]